MKPLDFYNWATAAAQGASSEAELRTVVGRLYYGLHHEACCRYFRVHPNASPLQRRGRHTQLKDKFNTEPDPVCKKIGNLLNDLLQLRGLADYEIGQLNFRNLVLTPDRLMGLAKIYADDLLEALQDFSPGEAEDGCICLTR